LASACIASSSCPFYDRRRLAELRAHALRYRELKGREITWALPG
jgi:hypothetical protein